ncbi:MAG TPA: hypothetical protein VF533_14805 [Solirubrobacteraceae bacterium]
MPIDADITSGPERRASRLIVHGWPATPDSALERAVAEVTTFEAGNAPPVVLGSGGGRHLEWRGTLTGGVLTLYEHLAPVLCRAGLDASLADPRLEVHVAAAGDVVVLRDDGRGPALARDEFERRIRQVDRGADAADVFAPRPGDSAPAGIAPRDADDGAAARSTWLEALTARVACAEVTVIERFDPDGFLEEAWSTCQALAWRVEFLTPGTCRAPDDLLEACLVWRVAEWEWAGGADAREVGRWRLRRQRPLEAREVAAALPGSLAGWVARATEEGIELCQALVDGGEPEFAGACRRLQAELAALGG